MKTFVMMLALLVSMSGVARAEDPWAGPEATEPAPSVNDGSESFHPKARLLKTATVDNTGPRLVSEVLLGGLGAAGMGFAGLLVGAASGSLAGATLGMSMGVLLGSTIGVDLGGNANGGIGNGWATFLGSLAGVVLTFVLPAPNAGVAIAMVVALPTVGAVVGYELSHAAAGSAKAAGHASGPRLYPAVGMTRQGHGAIAGLAGTF